MSESGHLINQPERQTLLRIGFTAILLGYLLVWLPHELAGLSFIGLELGEWVKFLPQYRAGQIAANRNFFYLPPITLGLMLVLWTTGWSSRRWQTWAMRALAVLVAMLALPAVEVVLDEGVDQWLGRLLLVMLVMVAALLAPLFDRLGSRKAHLVAWSATLVLAVMGLALPTWAYLAFRKPIGLLFDQPIGFGPGFWSNGIGHLLVALVAVFQLNGRRLQQARHAD